jgi:hypothetical protein
MDDATEPWRIAFATGAQEYYMGNHAAAVVSVTTALLGAPQSLRSKLLTLRALAHLGCFRHYGAYVDADAALALDRTDIQARKVRILVSQESGEFERAQADLAVLASKFYDPDVSQQQEILHQKIQSLTSYWEPRRRPTRAFLTHAFQGTTITDIPNLLSGIFDGFPLMDNFVQEAASALAAREDSRKGPVRFLGNITKLSVTGDLHGDLAALFKLFEQVGYPTADNPYLFNGNLTGEDPSVDLVVILVVAKALDDRAVHFNRGPLYVLISKKKK